MRTRTNLHLDNDALAYASMYANAKGIPLGTAISELIRRAEHAPEPPSAKLTTNRLGLLVKRKGDRTVTPELVKELSEDDIG